MFVVACGDPSSSSTDDGTVCGPGTALIGGACLPIDDSDTDVGSSGAAATTGSAEASTGDAAESSSGVDASSDGGGSSSSGEAPPVMIDLHDVTFHDNPTDLADWAETTMITRLVFQDDGVHVEFSKQDGPDRWPDIVPPGWDGPLQYTLGFVENIGGQWHASAAMQYWYGLDAQGGNVAQDNQVAVNWYYDGRWGEMSGYQPATGEMIGVFVIAGNVRGVLDGSQSPVHERTNVIVVPMPGVEGASYDF